MSACSGILYPTLHVSYLAFKNRGNTLSVVHLGGGIANLLAKDGQIVVRIVDMGSKHHERIFVRVNKLWQVTLGAFGHFIVFTFCWLCFFTIHVGAPLHASKRHFCCSSTPHNDRARSIAATSGGVNISKKGPRKGVQHCGAFRGGHFRGAGWSNSDDA
jgi:hypothetical protein